MNFETMQKGCKLLNCNLVKDGENVKFEFAKVTFTLAKDFDKEETELYLTIVKGWLGILKEALTSNEERKGGAL